MLIDFTTETAKTMSINEFHNTLALIALAIGYDVDEVEYEFGVAITKHGKRISNKKKNPTR